MDSAAPAAGLTADDHFFLGRRMQLSFVVDDMEAALAMWTRQLGVGPFVVFEQALADRQFIHRGQLSPVDMAVALAYVGDTQIELICQKNDARSIYTEAKSPLGARAHHVAFWPDDVDVACRFLALRGFEEVGRIQSREGVVDVRYFRSPASLGLMVEVAPMTSARRVYYSRIQEMCERPCTGEMVLRFTDKDDFLRSLHD